jgi:hypothetical protein
VDERPRLRVEERAPLLLEVERRLVVNGEEFRERQERVSAERLRAVP